MLILNRFAFLIYVATLSVFALFPSSQTEPLFPYFDKFLHFLCFLLLFFLYDRSTNHPVTLINLLSFFCYGLVLEFLQGFTATRSPEVWDIFANALGLLVYFIFAPKLRYRS